MKRNELHPTAVVNRFLEKLGNPFPAPNQSDAAAGRVLERIKNEHSQWSSPVRPVMLDRPSRNLPFWKQLATGTLAATAILATVLCGAYILQNANPAVDAHAIAENVNGNLYRGADPTLVREGDRIDGGEEVQVVGAGATLAMADGSRIEMRADSALKLETANDGVRVRLTSGSVIISASKQRQGHLYVETRDCTVSVVGTVFQVSTSDAGSRVAVIQGEVRVEREGHRDTLHPGEQVTTNPEMPTMPVTAEIAWSRNASAHLLLLQSAAPVAARTEPAQDRSGVVRGVVTRFQTTEGIPGATIALCETGSPATFETNSLDGLPPRDRISEIRIVNNPFVGGAQASNAPAVHVTLKGCVNPLTGTTDSLGRFEIGNVPPGQYSIRAERAGYVTPSDDPAADPSQSRGTVVSQKTLETLLSLVRAATISGVVRDSAGKLVVNATVRAGIFQNGAFKSSVSRSTNDRGEYRLFGLPPGTYYVFADDPKDKLAATAELAGYLAALAGTVPNSPTPAAPLPTYYPGARTQAEATAITVREGEEVPGIDITLQPQPAGR